MYLLWPVAGSWCVGDPNNINYMLAVKNVFLRGGGQRHPSWRGLSILSILSILSNKPASDCKMDTHSPIFSTSDLASDAQKRRILVCHGHLCGHGISESNKGAIYVSI